MMLALFEYLAAGWISEERRVALTTIALLALPTPAVSEAKDYARKQKGPAPTPGRYRIRRQAIATANSRDANQ
jgi:hypothetical protein